MDKDNLKQPIGLLLQTLSDCQKTHGSCSVQTERLLISSFCLKYHLKPRSGEKSLKNNGSHKIFSNFIALSLDFWWLYISCSLDFFTRISGVSIVCKASSYLFVCFYKLCRPLKIWTSHACVKYTLSSRSHNYKSQYVVGSQRKILVSPSRKVWHLPFSTFDTKLFHSYRRCTRKKLHSQLIMEPLLGLQN